MVEIKRIKVGELDTPDAFVSKYLIEHIGSNYRTDDGAYFDQQTSVWTIPLKLLIPQKCNCCDRLKNPIVKDGGHVKVKRDKNTMGYSLVSKNIKEYSDKELHLESSKRLYLLEDANHEGGDGVHGIFSTLAAAEQFQFDHNLGKTMTGVTAFEIDKPDVRIPVPQILRLSKKYEASVMAENPNYKQEKLAQAKWFCDDCEKELTACWDCGFFHCKCAIK